MGLWTAIVCVVLIISVASVLSSRHHTKHGITGDVMGNETPIAPAHDGEKAALKREVEDLRDRLQVLERITIDERESKSIAAEIEQLRDKK